MAFQQPDGLSQGGLGEVHVPHRHRHALVPRPAVSEDLQHICVRSCTTPNIIGLFGSQPTTAGVAAVMTIRAISGVSG